MSESTEGSVRSHEVRSFTVQIPEPALESLRARIAAARWPSRELVADRSQGVQLATNEELARYWEADYDWRRCESRLNALPQFKTEIDGVDVHFIHVKSPHPNVLALIVTHGWPGSVIELLEVVGPLTDPPAHGGRPEDAFDLVVPSIPGYGFSAEPTEIGWHAGRVAQAWAELMRRLGRPGRVQEERLWLFPGAGHAPPDDWLRVAGLTRSPGGLDDRPRHGQLLQNFPGLPR